MTLLDFSGWRRPHVDWSNQHLAEFYRVESALTQAQIPVEIDRGVTDEGDPWLVFAHVETGDIVVHFARERGSYIAAVPSIPWTARGSDLRALIAEFMQSHPVLLPPRAEKKSNVLLHPGALFTAFVATAFYLDGFRVSDAQAGEGAGEHKATSRAPHQASAPDRDADAAGEREYISKLALLAAVVIALGAGRDQAAGLISGLLSEASPDGSIDDIKALLAGLSDTGADVPPAFDNLSESASKSTLFAAVVSVGPTDGEVEGYQRASVRSDNSDILTAGASVEPTSSSVGASSPASPLPSEQSSTDVVEQQAPETLGAKLFAGSSAPSASFPGGEDATAATAAAVLAFVLETAPQTLTAQAGMLLAGQVISWVEQIARAPQGGQILADAAVFQASAESLTSSAPSIQSVVFDDAIRLNLVSQFLKSDTDIVTFVGQAAIVIYDASDLASGAGDIEIQTWQLSDAQSVSLIGSAAFFDHFYAPHLA